MRKLLLMSLLAFTGAAHAEPIAASWTGFYLGGHLGGAWQSESNKSFSDPNIINRVPTLAFSGSSDSFIGGIHGGYNWQFDPSWVAGAEADISWTDLNDSTTVAPLNTLVPIFPGSSLTMSEKANWLASVRARVGFLVWPDTLIYATGGVAWQNVDYSGVASFPSLPSVASTSFSKTNTGYVVGGGGEWAVLPHVLLRAEYLFYGFNQDQAATAGIPFQPLPYNFGWSSSDVQVARVGASYGF